MKNHLIQLIINQVGIFHYANYKSPHHHLLFFCYPTEWYVMQGHRNGTEIFIVNHFTVKSFMNSSRMQ